MSFLTFRLTDDYPCLNKDFILHYTFKLLWPNENLAISEYVYPAVTEGQGLQNINKG